MPRLTIAPCAIARWLGVIFCSFALTVFIAVLLCGMQSSDVMAIWNSRQPDIIVGPLNSEGFAWVSKTWISLGRTYCESDVVDRQMAKGYMASKRAIASPNVISRNDIPPWSIVTRISTPPQAVLPREGISSSICEFAYGWPARCLSYRIEFIEELRMARPASVAGDVWGQSFRFISGGPTFSNAIHADLLGEGWVAHDGNWPSQIIWRGMILNVLFFTAVFGSPWWIRALVRWRRARNGRCVRCGYSIAELNSEKCPECGSAAAVRQARSS